MGENKNIWLPVVLMIVFALWVAALVVMYFVTVYPNSDVRDDVTTSSS